MSIFIHRYIIIFFTINIDRYFRLRNLLRFLGSIYYCPLKYRLCVAGYLIPNNICICRMGDICIYYWFFRNKLKLNLLFSFVTRDIRFYKCNVLNFISFSNKSLWHFELPLTVIRYYYTVFSAANNNINSSTGLSPTNNCGRISISAAVIKPITKLNSGKAWRCSINFQYPSCIT